MADATDWHLKKEVSYGHIISTITLLGLMIGAYSQIEARLTRLETHLTQPGHRESELRLDMMQTELVKLSAHDSAQNQRIESLHAEILRRLDRQDMKLDRIETRLNEHDRNGNKVQ